MQMSENKSLDYNNGRCGDALNQSIYNMYQYWLCQAHIIWVWRLGAFLDTIPPLQHKGPALPTSIFISVTCRTIKICVETFTYSLILLFAALRADCGIGKQQSAHLHPRHLPRSQVTRLGRQEFELEVVRTRTGSIFHSVEPRWLCGGSIILGSRSQPTIQLQISACPANRWVLQAVHLRTVQSLLVSHSWTTDDQDTRAPIFPLGEYHSKTSQTRTRRHSRALEHLACPWAGASWFNDWHLRSAPVVSW